MGSTSEEFSISSKHHVSILNQVLEQSTAEESLIRSYSRSFNGFAAMLTEKEMQKLQNMKEVISVFPSRILELQTTRSWDFIGLPAETADTGHEQAESDMIIGVIDSGIWPESASFHDHGFGPAPKKWKGVCKGETNFTCNNKVIGARSYTGESARDENGHGSHTASTAAGVKVANASFYGLAAGTARGGAPWARIAVYKVCGSTGCEEYNIMAAFDDAIADGVDVISISIGGPASAFSSDVISIGAFHSMQNGILTVQSAGNDGNFTGTVGSVSPWIFTVAASTMDRKIVDKLVLGNNNTLVGMSVNSFTLKGDKFPVVYGKTASSQCGEQSARLCSPACLDGTLVKGKIVACDEPMGLTEAFRAGALGAVVLDSATNDVSFTVPLPAVFLATDEYKAFLAYINSTKAPMAKILKSEAIKDTAAPVVVSFSSRGPNSIASDILKPDITAPGVDILAAYSPVGSISSERGDKRKAAYNVISGTSMSCPHVAGAVAYVKSLHPDWHPSALKSALMTTAQAMSQFKNYDGEFAYGSGHINPVAAANPGLVYEATKADDIAFLCKSGYSDHKIRVISGDKAVSCPKGAAKPLSPIDMNYPSMSVRVGKPGESNVKESFSVTFHRTVTNVGVANSTYLAKMEVEGEKEGKIKVTVEPKTLSFRKLREQKSFNVTVAGYATQLPNDTPLSASLVWSDGVHNVRSPVIVYIVQ